MALSLNPSGGLAGYPEGIRWEVTGVPTWTFPTADLQSPVTASARREGNTALPPLYPVTLRRVTNYQTSISRGAVAEHILMFFRWSSGDEDTIRSKIRFATLNECAFHSFK